jgi:hypothetical protein
MQIQQSTKPKWVIAKLWILSALLLELATLGPLADQ